MKQLWVEKWRPPTIDGYVFKDEDQKKQIQSWIDQGSIPHLLFSGRPGTGKTTISKILINQLGVKKCDVKEINASRDNGVQFVRDTIQGFAQTRPVGKFKVVLLDEADYLSPEAQAVLRGFLETYASTVRFILTCNYPNKIIPAIHSRTQGFHIENLDKGEFTYRVAEILTFENINVDVDMLDTYVDRAYPDLRKCINLCQMNSSSGTLEPLSGDENTSNEDMEKVVDLIKKRDITNARKLLCSLYRPEDMENVFRWMYDNLELWGDNDIIQDKAIIIIRDALVNHTLISDPEINVSACLIELCSINDDDN